MKTDNDKRLKQWLEEALPTPALPEGSYERFLRQLDKTRARRRSRRHLRICIAASLALAACLAGFVFWHRPAEPAAIEEPTRAELTIAEIRGYYKALLWNESQYLAILAAEMEPAVRDTLLAEMERIQEGPEAEVEDIMDDAIPRDEKIAFITRTYSSHLHRMKCLCADVYKERNEQSQQQ